jgi:transposase
VRAAVLTRRAARGACAVAKRGRTRRTGCVDLRQLSDVTLRTLLCKAERRIKDVRTARQREIAADLVARFPIIVVGRVSVEDMVSRATRNVSGTTAATIMRAAMRSFVRVLREAASHAVGRIVLEVDESYSTACCPSWECERVRRGVGAAKQPQCEHCGRVTRSRDAAAARQILVLLLTRRRWTGAPRWAVDAAAAADARAGPGRRRRRRRRRRRASASAGRPAGVGAAGGSDAPAGRPAAA